MCQDNSLIDEFLEKLHLSKYREKFQQNEELKVRNLEDLKKYLDHPEFLKDIGLTAFEVSRFKRLFSHSFQEMMEKGLSLENHFQQEKVKNSICRDTSNTISKQESRPILTLRFKCLTTEGIICNKINEISFEKAILFYELVSNIFNAVVKIIKGLNFNSVELYSVTGYPLATTPSIYIQPIANWRLQANELIYVYPKTLTNDNEFMTKMTKIEDCKEFVIRIQLKRSVITKELKFYKNHVSIKDLKYSLSLQMHIHFNCIIIWQFCSVKESENIVEDTKEYVRKEFKEGTLSFSISDTFNDSEIFSAFRPDYTSCYPCTNHIEDFHTFNAYLLYLVRENTENEDRDRLLRRLGLLRKISCSPPLVYALYLLFTGSSISLPHRIAINEGLITTISLLSCSLDPPTVSKFPQLWMHIEEHALMYDLLITEIYETTFISKQIRDNPRNVDICRLLQAFSPKQEYLITWRNSPSTHDAFNYTPQSRLEDFTEGVNTRFPLHHPVELYMRFLQNGKSYGLMKPLINNLKSPCVFLGRTHGTYGYFNYFSPEDGICHSYNAWTNTVPYTGACSLINEDSNLYPLMIIVLDMSKDMRQSYLDINKKQLINEKIDLIENALIMIDLFLDELKRTPCNYLLGAVVISNSHDFHRGFREISKPTFEYQFVCEELTNTVKKNHIQKVFEKGILIQALNSIFEKYSCNPNQNIINIFTNSEKNMKYEESNFERDLSKMPKNFRINTIIFKGHGHAIKKLSKMTCGYHTCLQTVITNFSQNSYVNYGTKDMLINYLVHLLRKIIYPDDTRLEENYNNFRERFSKHKISTMLEWLDNINDDRSTYQNNKVDDRKSVWFHILKQITKCMRNPNPHCRIYSYGDNILKWLLFINSPTDLAIKTIWITELEFGQNYPHSPPNIRCLTPVYHPNVTPSGKICHPILFEDYNYNVSLRAILDHLVELMLTPILTHVIDHEMIEVFWWDKELYSKMNNGNMEMFLIPENIEKVEHDLNIIQPLLTMQCTFLTCPLTKQLFSSPVTTPEGRTYEQDAILQYLKANPKDPFTNNPLEVKQLVSNHAIASAVYKYKLDNPVKIYWWEN